MSDVAATPSIVSQLVKKDLSIMRKPLLFWWLAGIGSVAIAFFGGDSAAIFALIMFITGIAGAAVHSIMRTIVEERREQTLAFIMSLPISMEEYTSSKLIANIVMFVPIWVSLSIAGMVVFIEGLPLGTFAFYTIILVAIFLAFTLMLAVSLVFESLGAAVCVMVVANIGTQAFLWWASDLEGIESVRGSPEVIWNATSISILAAQIATIVGLVILTYVLQVRKKDFV